MARNRLVLIGGGGHALVVADAASQAGFELVGVLDDNPRNTLTDPEAVLAAPYLGPLANLAAIRQEGAEWVLALGDLGLRRKVLARVAEAGLGPAAAVVHPDSHVSPSASIGAGVYVGPGAVVHTRAILGDHAIVNSGSIVEHECRIGENVHIAPGSALAGRVRVGPDTLIGLGSRVLPNGRIGQGCVVGAGAVVVRPVSDGAVVVGVPAGSLGPG